MLISAHNQVAPAEGRKFVQDPANDYSSRPTTTSVFASISLTTLSRPISQEVGESIRDLIDPTLQLGLGEIRYRPNQVMHLQANIDRLHDATGFLPRVDLAEGLSQTVQWHRQQLDRPDLRTRANNNLCRNAG